LKDDTTLCKLIRVSVDLSTSEWTDQLTACGFSPDIPTFWILEGLVYYLEWETVNSVLRETVRVSAEDSQIFVDVGIPALADLVFGPFTRHFKWGMNKEDVPAFFAAVGWDVSCSFADDHDQGRDVGQKGLIFVHGTLNRQLAIDEDSMVPKPVSSEDVTLAADDPELQTFAGELTARIIPEVEGIVEAYKRDPAEGLSDYLEFVKRVKPSVERIAKGQHILSLGKISPRLLGNPLSIESADDSRTPEEEESHVTGYLKAILQLVYCGAKGVEGWQFVDTPLHEESQKTRSVGRIDTLLPMVRIVKQELVNKQDQT
ncbi:MAG: class I SAM-dependent methyltransferase, partial [Candidatus Thorarchaeota archaeon]